MVKRIPEQDIRRRAAAHAGPADLGRGGMRRPAGGGGGIL
jgi:hypothetical protein